MRAWSRFRKSCHFVRIGAIGVLSLNTVAFNVIADDKTTDTNKVLRIGIIGAGIGGASTSYFLRELLDKHNGQHVSIDIYDKNDYVGGRVMCANLEAYSGGNYQKDIGATLFIKQNYYMMNFAKNILKLNVVHESDKKDRLGFAFFDEPRGKLSEVWDERFGTFKLIKRWGFLPFIGLMYTARNFVKNFGEIYTLQQNGTSFDNAIDLWNELHLSDALYGYGMEYMNKEINKFVPSFLSSKSQLYAPSVLQLVTALTRANYTQQPNDVPPIVTAAAVSILAANGLCHVAEGGNSLIEAGLIEKSKANLYLNYEIKSITQNDRYKYILNKDNGLEYDYVIIATPLSLANINIEMDHSERMDILSKQEYVDVHKHYVKGRLNAKYFGFDDNASEHLENVGTIFSSNLGALHMYNTKERRVMHKDLPCTTIERTAGSEWITFMGSERFSEHILDDIMESWDRDSLQRFHFKAYPKFKWNRQNIDCLSLPEQKKVLSFCMDRNEENKNGGLYYLNVLECGLSAQEVMAVAGKNVALLVSKQIASCKPVD